LVLAVELAVTSSAETPDNPWLGPDLMMAEKTNSPNGRYAVAEPTFDASIDRDPAVLYQLADVTAHRVVGKLPTSDDWLRRADCSVVVWWAPDSSCCAIAHVNRFGFDGCVAVDLHHDSFRATAIWTQIETALETVIRKQLRHPNEERAFGLRVRPRPDGTLLVRADGTSNRHGTPEEETRDAFLAGTYDLATGKWTKLNTRPIDPKLQMMSALDSDEGELVRLRPPPNASEPSDYSGEYAANEQERAKMLDRLLNETYAAVRFAVSPARFAKIKEEQKAWLASWVEQKSQPEKNAMTDARVRQLRAILWEEG
jgi:hypothetical protein